jgi:glyoxylase-like metal-dependent hydrolase (beta-lactamase superfamily II)
MARTRMLNRRMFLTDLGRGTVAIAILGGAGAIAAACNDDDDDAPAAATEATSTATATATEAPSPAAGEAAADRVAAASLHRVSLGFVSAYVLARDGRAAVVDTGVAGSAPDIGDALTAAGVGWDGVGDVIVTHLHPDHQGSLAEVLALAPSATAYAGAADIGGIASPRPLVAVGDGDEVFGLQIVATPGHTAGHICVLDAAGGLLVAGDALVGAEGGGVGGPNPEFTPDLATAHDSVRKLAMLDFETVVFGHGEPVEGGAAAAVAALAATL